jgi:hypothetical protein
MRIEIKTRVDTYVAKNIHETDRSVTQHKHWQLETETLTWEKTSGATRFEEAHAALGAETK